MDDDDDFECDIEKFVPFEDKLLFAEKLKSVSRECLTELTKLLIEIQPQSVDDFQNSRMQLKIDLVERDSFLKCIEIIGKHEGAKAQSFTSKLKVVESQPQSQATTLRKDL